MKYKVFLPSNYLSTIKCYPYNSINRKEMVNYTAMFDFYFWIVIVNAEAVFEFDLILDLLKSIKVRGSWDSKQVPALTYLLNADLCGKCHCFSF